MLRQRRCFNSFAIQKPFFILVAIGCCVVVAVITPSLSRDGGTARTAVQVHAVNLIEFWLGERWQPISNHL